MRALVIAAVFCASTALAEDERRGPPNQYFAGTYEFTGRSPGANGKHYGGWATITDGGDHLSIARCLGGETEIGKLSYSEWGPDRLIFFKGALWGGIGATCEFSNDNENYPRLACVTYPTSDERIEIPGVETYMRARWPQPDHAKGCE